ncbi:dihydroorotase [Ileibacterium valens]|uniref:dihydroorotase n=1 Tax=Ileibacterium valens TaxID=1862668 RepID=UPI00272DB2C4|nr:dihydroorotase [Ileibacterium valens]
MKAILKNGKILQNDTLQKADILFDEEQILKIDENIIAEDENTKVIDASGLGILPGLVDTHVHLRDPGYTHKETLATGSAAAAHGGFTTIFAMPNTKPFPSTPEAVKTMLERVDQEALVRVIPFATITVNEAGQKPTDYAAIKELGISWFSDDGVGVASSDVMEEAMKQAKAADVMFSCHTEDMNFRRPAASVHTSNWADQNGWIGIPSQTESEQLIRDLKLAREIGLKYHADHISAKESVEALHQAKQEGVDVSAEVTVHHLLLEDHDVRGPNWKMNPPLRSHEDRMALIEGLENGDLDFIANDHAPHAKEEKERGMEKAPFGIVALETAFPLLYTEFVSRQKRWSLGQLVNWMSAAPARRFGLERTGEIKEGYRPDFVLVNFDKQEVIDPDQFLSKGKNTPFGGWITDCVIEETLCNGKTVYQSKERKAKHE